jgi:hypothetical protein
MLKERRRLVIVPRETPMSLPQLKNMVLCAEAGAMILPAMPAFYQLPNRSTIWRISWPARSSAPGFETTIPRGRRIGGGRGSMKCDDRVK